jgi:two-component system, chemotaxis family, chemotaxis protein CheY
MAGHPNQPGQAGRKKAMAIRKVLSVGQCGMDHSAIRRLLQLRFDADVVPADSAGEAWTELRHGQYDLVLVNRIFDMGGSGLEFIADLKADQSLNRVPAMLVSDLPEAQRKAVELGALPGFGKAALHRPETVERIASAMGGGPQGRLPSLPPKE